MMIEAWEVEEAVRKLNAAKKISEFHFRDAVQELMEQIDSDRQPWE